MKKKKITIVQLKKDIAEFARDLSYEKRRKEDLLEQLSNIEVKNKELESKINHYQMIEREEMMQKDSEVHWLRELIEHITVSPEKLEMLSKLRDSKEEARRMGRPF